MNNVQYFNEGTVKELIEKLSHMNPLAKVYIGHDECREEHYDDDNELYTVGKENSFIKTIDDIADTAKGMNGKFIGYVTIG